MSLASLDFQGAIRSHGLVVYRWFGETKRWIVLPHALDVCLKPDGTPDFQLDLVRSREPGLAAYGVVDFRIGGVADLEAARAAVPGERVEAGHFAGGWLRLLVREPGKAETAMVLPPVQIAANGLGVVRLASRLSPEGIVLLKRALLEGTVLVEAWGEMVLEGVAPRLPTAATLQAADLAALEPGLTGGVVSRAAVVQVLKRLNVLSGISPGVDLAQAAEAVADRLFNLAGTLAPSPSHETPSECWRLDLGSMQSRFEWDLRQPIVAQRVVPLRFDPVGLVRKAVASGGLEKLVTHRELSDFQTGYVPVLVTANLPDVRTPVLSCGVDIEGPARPPHRFNVIRHTVEFDPPADRKEIVLRFAADETPACQVQTFVFATTSAGVQEWRALRKDHLGGELRLSVDDFAARFIPVQASPQLLNEGQIRVTALWEGMSQTLTLAPDQPADTLVYDAAAPSVTFECVLSRSGRDLHAPIPGGSPLVLDLFLFREYGSHDVEIDIDFSDAPRLVALELKPENEADSAAAVVSFTTARPKRHWSWFASSPFAPGYRYRPFQSDRGAGWSAPQSPFAPLHLKAQDLLGNPTAVEGGRT